MGARRKIQTRFPSSQSNILHRILIFPTIPRYLQIIIVYHCHWEAILKSKQVMAKPKATRGVKG